MFLKSGKVFIAIVGERHVVGSFVPSGQGVAFVPATNCLELEKQAREDAFLQKGDEGLGLVFSACPHTLAQRAIFHRAWTGVLAYYGISGAGGDVIPKEVAIAVAQESIGQEVMGYYPGEIWVITGYEVKGNEKRGKIVAQVANREVWRALQDVNAVKPVE